MADKIIKLIDYMLQNPIVRALSVFYVIWFIVVFVVVIGIIIFTIKNIHDIHKHWR